MILAPILGSPIRFAARSEREAALKFVAYAVRSSADTVRFESARRPSATWFVAESMKATTDPKLRFSLSRSIAVGTWTRKDGVLDVNPMMAAATPTGESERNGRAVSIALSHPRLGHWIDEGCTISVIVSSMDRRDLFFGDLQNKVGGVQMASLVKGKVVEITNGH